MGSFLPVSSQWLHLKGAADDGPQVRGWHGLSKAATNNHISSLTAREKFRGDFGVGKKQFHGSAYLRLQAMNSGFHG